MNLISISGQMFSKINSILNTKSKRGSYPNEEPLRSELFTSEKMERFGKKLASSHKLNTNPSHDHLLPRLAENEIILHEVRKLLTDSIRRKNQITPAGEWLIDNFYLIEEHIRNAKIDFPKGYSENLPQLIHGNATVVTRIYDIILHIISHSDGRIDIDSLSTYINAYHHIKDNSDLFHKALIDCEATGPEFLAGVEKLKPMLDIGAATLAISKAALHSPWSFPANALHAKSSFSSGDFKSCGQYAGADVKLILLEL